LPEVPAVLKITSSQVAAFRNIVDEFGLPNLPPPNSWKTKSDDDVWIQAVSAVAVIGNARPADKLRTPAIRTQISWNYVREMDDGAAAWAIWKVLREVGTRYAGKQMATCGPTKSLVKNRNVLRDFRGGPRGFLHAVATLEGGSNRKIEFITERFSRIKEKGARDFLISGFGIIQNHVALDIRVKGVLKHFGIQLPPNATSDPDVYRAVEENLDMAICQPLGIKLAQLDQLLFQNYQQIKTLRPACPPIH